MILIKKTRFNIKDLVDQITDGNKHELLIDFVKPVTKEYW